MTTRSGSIKMGNVLMTALVWEYSRVFSMGAILATTQSTPLAKTQQVMVTKSCTTTGEVWYLHLGCGQLVKFVA